MTVYVASRHYGALKWLIKHGYTGVVEAHWNKQMTKKVTPDDTVVGNLPIYVIEQILARGAKVYLIGVPGWPGNHRTKAVRDLSPEEMDEKKAFLTEVKQVTLERIKMKK